MCSWPSSFQECLTWYVTVAVPRPSVKGSFADLGLPDVRLTTAQVEAYKSARLAAGAMPATVNRELAALSRMASLAKHQHGLAVSFVVERLEERNVRVGFFEDACLG